MSVIVPTKIVPTKTALVLLPTFSQTIEQRICAGIESVLSAQGIRVLHVPLGYLPEAESELEPYLWIHRKLRALKPDVIFAYGGGLSYRTAPAIYQQVLDIYGATPIINMGNKMKGYPSIVVDNYTGMLELMTTVLTRRPNEKILFISGPRWNEDSKFRFAALQHVMLEQGRNFGDVEQLAGDFTASVAQHLFASYLDGQNSPARLIICANDLTAKGVLDELKQRNLDCPKDFWVTGFDDFEYAASMQPGLSTVHFPARDVGIQAAQCAAELFRGDVAAIEVKTHTVKAYPVLRGTTGDVHPGLGAYDKQLSEQWALIHQRDANARKLTAIRSFQRRLPMSELLTSSKHLLADLDIQHLSVFTEKLGDDGIHYLTEIDLNGQASAPVAAKIILPQAINEATDESYWLLCALEMENDHFGYLTAKCDKVSAEFVEFLAPQISEQLNTDALEARNENYRLQNELNERMASLGSLVSGVAHEVNTPIGTGKLAASSLLNAMAEMADKVSDHTLTKNDFDIFLKEANEYAGIIFNSLDRAANLISNFKMVSVDQSAEAKRRFDLSEYIESILIGLRHQIKGTPVELKTELDADIWVETYPGALAQVITNLFMNALAHGFDNANNAGTILIRLRQQRSGFTLEVADDGKGASTDVVKHIFDPFFTTTRAAGGSGLGMHIVFNLITQKLNWHIAVKSKPNEGLRVIIQP